MGVINGYYTSFMYLILLLILQRSNCTTVVVNGVIQWKNPTANIGDTIIFKHKNQYKLYIFRTQEAYNSCNFTQASPLSNLNNSTFTWHPSRTGDYYFAFYNSTNIPCLQAQKLAIKITTAVATPPTSPQSPTPEIQPPATPGGIVSSSPSYPWPFQPREREGGASPGPTYTDVGIAPMPAMSPSMASVPFINSNPAVPLPTGEVDSATIQPLPTPANHSSRSQAVKLGCSIEPVLSLCFVSIVMVILIR